MSHGKSCFFIGHREADERLLPRLKLTIERLITEENVRFFYVGEYGGFDRIAAAAVKHAKQKYPDITRCHITRPSVQLMHQMGLMAPTIRTD